MASAIFHFISPPIPYFIDCGRAFYEAGDRHISRNNIGVFDLIMVKRGTLYIGEGAKEWEIAEGEAFILRPDTNHFGMEPCKEQTEIIWIHFQTFGAWDECDCMDTCLEKQSLLIDKHKKRAYLNHSEVSSIFIPKHVKLIPKAMDDLEHFFLLDQEPHSLRNWKRQTTFQQYLQHLDMDQSTFADATAFQIAEKVELFIRQNYSKPLSNPILQQELNYHPNYLSKCMLKVYNKTPMEYLQGYRIEQAKKLLISTEWSVSRIAEAVGFNHFSYFSVCFSNKEGISPLNYRRKFVGHP